MNKLLVSLGKQLIKIFWRIILMLSFIPLIVGVVISLILWFPSWLFANINPVTRFVEFSGNKIIWLDNKTY